MHLPLASVYTQISLNNQTLNRRGLSPPETAKESKMAIASFYLLDKSHHDSQHTIFEKTAQLCASFCQQGFKIHILANDKSCAEKIDEYLWQCSPDFFVPHILSGENTRGGAQLEIGWSAIASIRHRQILINLADQAPTFAPAFAQVVDFVPCDEIRKQQARERYKIYRMAGCQIQTVAIEKNS